MSKPPRMPGRPAHPGKAGAKANKRQLNPWSRVIAATEASLLEESSKRAANDAAAPDAELLAECAIVDRVNVRPALITEEELERAILRASVRLPQTVAGWRAKVEMALLLLQAGRETDGESDDYDRMVPWLVLNDMLALLNTLEPLVGTSAI